MSVTPISLPNKYLLWGMAGGRCEYEGCNKPLYRDDLTKAEFNQAYIAHIIADVPGGPRGDAILSEQLKDNLSNLMLLCDTHHRLIDKQDVVGHPVNRLQKMKKDHEERIEILTDIKVEKRSHVILYGARIGEHGTPLTISETYLALTPERYPAHCKPIELGFKNSSYRDKTEDFWNIEDHNLQKLFHEKVTPLKGTDEVQHFSIFALAPMPLLIRLGTLLSDIYSADVFQRHREPSTWIWQQSAEVNDIVLEEPLEKTGIPILKIALSATITDDRISAVVTEKHSIWTITINTPSNDFLKTKSLLQQFRQICRKAFDQIKATHGEKSKVYVFPAMPVASAVELGRVWMPKADLPMVIYDQNSEAGGFIQALEIGGTY